MRFVVTPICKCDYLVVAPTFFFFFHETNVVESATPIDVGVRGTPTMNGAMNHFCALQTVRLGTINGSDKGR